MKILVTYFTDDQKSETLEFDVDSDTRITDIEKLASEQVGHEIIFIPMIMSYHHEQSIGEYYQAIKGQTRQNHFNAIKPNTLSTDEQAILRNLNLLTGSAATTQISSMQNTERFIRFISKVLPDDLQEALVVRLGDRTTMFGATFHDKLTQAVKENRLRSSIQLHPYPWLAAGSSCVIVHENQLCS